MLHVDRLSLGYGDAEVVHDVSLRLAPGRHTVVVGPNGCGKSTLLRGAAGLLRPQSGRVLLGDDDVAAMRRRDVARRLALLPQGPVAPEGLTVRELVARGRHPHQGMWAGWSVGDERVVDETLEQVGLTDLADRAVETLSGGQRQRAWVALVLAQRTELLLLDEPTTFLDLAHSCEVLAVVRDAAADGRTVVSVLHDLSLAARFADEFVVVADGRVVAQGEPVDVLTADLLADVFGLRAEVVQVHGRPVVAPLG